MNNTSDLYLSHHGIKGMKWGVRRYEDANGHLTPEGKRRYAVQDARKYYKINRLQRAQEKNRDPDKNEKLSRRIRRVQTRSDRKHADLSQKDINVGRQIVAKNRRNWAMVGTAAKAAATAAGAYALYQNPKTRALAPLAVAGGAAMTFGSAKKVPYYGMEARRYKQVNPKGATKKGLTKRQQALRKAGKIAATAAIAGAAGYALYKTGAGKAMIDKGKSIMSGRNADISLNTPSNQNSTKSPSSATKAVYDANKRYKAARNTPVGKTAKSRISDAKSTVKSAVANKVRDKIFDDVDTEDPRTWINGVRNVKDTVNTAKRYGRAANKLRKGDKLGAALDVSEDVNKLTSKAAVGVRDKVKNARYNLKKNR